MAFPCSSSILTLGRRSFIWVLTKRNASGADGTHSRVSLMPVPVKTTNPFAIRAPCFWTSVNMGDGHKTEPPPSRPDGRFAVAAIGQAPFRLSADDLPVLRSATMS